VGAIWAINKINRSKTLEAQQHLKEQEQLYLRTVESLALAVDAKDQTTYGHIRRVRAYAMGLARLSGLADPKDLMAIETGSLLHDIGKLAIDDYILNKPGRLNKQEFEKMKMHTTAGDEILQQIQFPFPVGPVVRCHHERWDGLGYPDGLKGEEIPLGARILAIADSFDAIRSSRPYKLSFGTQDSIEILRAQAGTLYDPRLVQLFIEHAPELEQTAEEEAKSVPKLSFRGYFEKVDHAISIEDSALSQRQLQPHARDASAELVLLSEFCSSLGKHLELSDIFPILTRKLERLLPFDTCIFFLENDDDTLSCAHAGGKFAEQLADLRLDLGKGTSGWAVAYKRPLLNALPALEFQGVACEIKSFGDSLVVPLVAEGNCMGAVSLYAQVAATFNQEHLALLQTIAGQFAPLISEARLQRQQSHESGLTDPVTQTYRAGYLSVAGAQLISEAERSQSPLSLLYLNIKNLSQMTNLYGMNASDTIMYKVAETLKTELRETDVLVRFGHQGFVALLPGVRREQATRYAQRLQHQIRSSSNINPGGQTFLINCQAALASFPADGTSVFSLLQSAQKSLSEHGRASGQAEGAEGNILEFPIRI
jgi:diguanylate cyclase (GGDEF)-like protein/putative nucleotidyltransferase with HDIG domain